MIKAVSEKAGLGARGAVQPRPGVRALAAWVVERALSTRLPLPTLLDPARDRLSELDRRLLFELVRGTLRWLRRIDAVLEQAAERPVGKLQPELLAPLRLGAYQLLFLERVPPHAVISEAVEDVRSRVHRGAAGLANAVLRRIARNPQLEAWPVAISDPIRRLAIETSHPDLLVERWWHRFGEDRTRKLLETNNRIKALGILAFRDLGGRELLAEALIDEGLEVEASSIAPLGLVVRKGKPWATRAFAEGRFYLQDEASQVAALVPPPRIGERVLDVAAAPGGKGWSLLASQPSVQLFSADLSLERLGLLLRNRRRLKRPGPTFVADAATGPWQPVFDRVVLDAPCSGTGTLRKHPELKWRFSLRELERLSSEGRRLLLGASKAVAPGGILCWITCSLEEEENESVARWFLETVPGFRLLELEDWVREEHRFGIVGPGLWRCFPEQEHDGFSVIVFERVEVS